jgi:hypothetical protein
LANNLKKLFEQTQKNKKEINQNNIFAYSQTKQELLKLMQ